jgi:hypothetical protein
MIHKPKSGLQHLINPLLLMATDMILGIIKLTLLERN